MSDAMTEWRGAVYREDGARVVELLRAAAPPSLQLAGDGLLVALAQGVGGAVDLVGPLVHALRERGLGGDEVLAEELEGAGGLGPVPLRRPVSVDLDELAMFMESDAAMGDVLFDLHTGEIRVDMDEGVTGEEPAAEGGNWVEIGRRSSRDGWAAMEQFVRALGDRAFGDRLRRAIEGRGAFRRFKDVLAERAEVLGAWYAFKEDRDRARARAWLAEEGLRPQVGKPAS